MANGNWKAKLVMHDAWRIARQAARTFGGKPREFIALALAQAWKKLKENPVVSGCAEIIASIRTRKAAATHKPCIIGQRHHKCAYYAAGW